MLSRYRTRSGDGTGLSREEETPGPTLTLSGLSPRLEMLDPRLSFEEDLSNTDFDWVWTPPIVMAKTGLTISGYLGCHNR